LIFKKLLFPASKKETKANVLSTDVMIHAFYSKYQHYFLFFNLQQFNNPLSYRKKNISLTKFEKSLIADRNGSDGIKQSE
jgi:hypothetical protein